MNELINYVYLLWLGLVGFGLRLLACNYAYFIAIIILNTWNV